MSIRTVDNIDDAYQIFSEFMEAAEKREYVRLSPRQAAMVAQLVVARRSNAAPYLEAAVRQAGGRVHLDTEHLERSSGSAVKYRPDVEAGSGGLLYIAEETDA